MVPNGLMMFGHSIQKLSLGLNLIASATYLLRVKGIRLRWWTMSCTYLEVVPKRVRTWAIWQHSGSLRGVGTLSKIWVRLRRHGRATA